MIIHRTATQEIRGKSGSGTSAPAEAPPNRYKTKSIIDISITKKAVNLNMN